MSYFTKIFSRFGRTKETNDAQDRAGDSPDTEAAIAKRLDDFENSGVDVAPGPERTDGGDAPSLYSDGVADTTGPEGDEVPEVVIVNVFWARTKSGTSYHILTEAQDRTLCNRAARKGEALDQRPASTKTCETCLRQVSPK